MKKFVIILVALLLVTASLSAQGLREAVEAGRKAEAPKAEKVWAYEPGIKAESLYKVVGYNFLSKVDGNVVTLNFIDIYSAEKLEALCADVKACVPGAVAAEIAASGKIAVKAEKALTEEDFGEYAAAVEKVAYKLFF